MQGKSIQSCNIYNLKFTRANHKQFKTIRGEGCTSNILLIKQDALKEITICYFIYIITNQMRKFQMTRLELESISETKQKKWASYHH